MFQNLAVSIVWLFNVSFVLWSPILSPTVFHYTAVLMEYVLHAVMVGGVNLTVWKR